MRPSKEETMAVPIPPQGEETASPATTKTRTHQYEDQLSDLLASRVVRQALQPVVERIGAVPGGGAFCVASAESDEGRTLVATTLALMLSEKRDRNVLLVDAHTQEACIHRLFDVPGSPGFTDCLLAERFLRDAVSSVGRLSVMPAGRDDGWPRLFRTGAAKRLVEEIGKTYDLALIDLPPLTSTSADAAALCDSADGTVMVVRANATKASAVAKAVEMIDSHKVLGVVLNREREDMPRWLQRLL